MRFPLAQVFLLTAAVYHPVTALPHRPLPNTNNADTTALCNPTPGNEHQQLVRRTVAISRLCQTAINTVKNQAQTRRPITVASCATRTCQSALSATDNGLKTIYEKADEFDREYPHIGRTGRSARKLAAYGVASVGSALLVDQLIDKKNEAIQENSSNPMNNGNPVLAPQTNRDMPEAKPVTDHSPTKKETDPASSSKKDIPKAKPVHDHSLTKNKPQASASGTSQDLPEVKQVAPPNSADAKHPSKP